MQRLGYTKYVAQGGDWGNAVSEVMALQEPPGLLGIHTNMAATVPANISRALGFHEAPPADLTAELEGDANGAPHPEPSTYAKKFSGKYSHRIIKGGIGHNLPQEAPRGFAEAIIDVAEI